MNRIKSTLMFSAASLAVVGAANAADLPVKKAAPIEYVRVCGAYGAGFFYIPGTDTCLRVSGRARFEAGYAPTYFRSGTAADTTGYRGLMRINLDARTQTDYGTLRAFVRLEAASRTGAVQGIRSGTQERIGNAFGATGQDTFGRAQQFMNVDKAFIQFAGLTAGRASSFFDFYAHDFEIVAATAGSDVQSTNLLAYTYAPGGGFSATISMEDPTFRKNTIYSQEYTTTVGISSGNANTRVLTGFAGATPLYSTVNVSEANRVPDFVGVLRYDQAWGSVQLSGAVKEINTGDFNYAAPAANPVLAGQPGGRQGLPIPATTPVVTPHSSSDYGFAVQAGLKVNMPYIAPGDSVYLQAAYGQGATLYTGYSAQPGSYVSNIVTLNGSPFNQYLSDATFNPFTGKIQTSESWTVTAAYLHYWSPQWRSAFFGSYGELEFANGAREANFLAYSGFNNSVGSATFTGRGPITGNSFALSPVLRDNYQILAGASLIWSPVKDLDIGFEGIYNRIGVKSGRVVDVTQNPNIVTINNATGNFSSPVKTADSADNFIGRFRVQRDF